MTTHPFISTAAPDAAVLGLLHGIYGKARPQVASPGGPSSCAHVAETCLQLHDLVHQVQKRASHYIGPAYHKERAKDGFRGPE